eukprot:6342803-Amphidinium_carterae.2
MVRSRSSSSKNVPLQRAHWEFTWALEEPPGSSVAPSGACACSAALDPDECGATRRSSARPGTRWKGWQSSTTLLLGSLAFVSLKPPGFRFTWLSGYSTKITPGALVTGDIPATLRASRASISRSEATKVWADLESLAQDLRVLGRDGHTSIHRIINSNLWVHPNVLNRTQKPCLQ